jgi:hypothetical protein
VNKYRTILLIFFVITLTGCSTSPEKTSPFQTNQSSKGSKFCQLVTGQFDQYIVSPNKSLRITAWQLIIDSPDCFTNGSLEVALKELRFLREQIK